MSTIVPFGAMLEMLYSAVNQPVEMQNRFFFVKDTNWTNADLQDLVDAAITAWDTHLQPLVSDGVRFTGARARNVAVNPWGPPVEELLTTPLVGAVGGDPNPYLASATVVFRSEAGEEPRRGYIRHTGIADSQASGNGYLLSYRTDLANAYLAFVNAIETDVLTADHVIVSLFDGHTLETHPDGTVTKKPTPRATALVAGVATYTVSPSIGRAVSRSGLRR